MRIIVFCAISGLGLLGCTAQEKAQMELQQKTKMESALTPYVGRSIADFMIDRGPSTSTIDLGDNKRAFQWKITAQTATVLADHGAPLKRLDVAGVQLDCRRP